MQLFVHSIGIDSIAPWALVVETGLQNEVQIKRITAGGEDILPTHLQHLPLPILEDDDGNVVFQTHAIMRYLVVKFKAAHLFVPEDLPSRTRMDLALEMRNTSIAGRVGHLALPALSSVLEKRHGIGAKEGELQEEETDVIAHGKEEEKKSSVDEVKALRDALDVFAKVFLAGPAKYVGGDWPCIADLSVVASLLYLQATDFVPSDAIRDYIVRVVEHVPAIGTVSDTFLTHLIRQTCEAKGIKSGFSTAAPLTSGRRVPDVELTEDTYGLTHRSQSLLGSGVVVVVAVRGAFFPEDEELIKGYLASHKALVAAGVSMVACVTVNDAFVAHAWGQKLKTEGKIRMLGDPLGEFAKAMGMQIDAADTPVHYRSKRYAAIVHNTVLSAVLSDDEGSNDACSAAAVLKVLTPPPTSRPAVKQQQQQQ